MCGGNVSSSTGLFYPVDHDFDGFYDNYQRCFWILSSLDDNIIELQFEEFDVEFHSACAFDFVMVC